jgi:CheY-like chemotaxis protein
MNILVVDDDPLVRQLLNAVLTIEGWSVELASSGQEGLAACRRSLPDIVTLDYNMPGMTGIEVAAQLVQEKFTVPIVVFTAAHTPELEEEAAALGVHAVSKAEMDKLVQLIREVVPAPATGRWRLRGGRRSP